MCNFFLCILSPYKMCVIASKDWEEIISTLLPVLLSIPCSKLLWFRGSTAFTISRHLKCHQQKRSLATLIKGQEAAQKILSQVSKDLEVLKSIGIKPKVVVGVVGNDPASRIYLNRKKAAALKGQLISKCPFGVFKSTKKPMKFL